MAQDGGHQAAKRVSIAAWIRQGTQRHAILFSVGANAKHGLRRTNEDKRRAVMRMLDDAEWSKWSDRKIAEQCSVSDKTVAKYRQEASLRNSEDSGSGKRKVERGGTVYEQDTTKIGKAQAGPEAETPATGKTAAAASCVMRTTGIAS